MGAVRKNQNITQLMIEQKLISAEDLQVAKESQKKEGGSLTSNLVKVGAISDNEMTSFLARAHGLPIIDLSTFEIAPEVISLVNVNICKKLKVIPTSKFGNRLVVAFANPDNYFAIEDLSHITRCKIEVVVASKDAIDQAIEKYYSVPGEKQSNVANVMQQFEEADPTQSTIDPSAIVAGQVDAEPIINFVNQILTDAIQRKVSDIHIEPFEKKFRIRYRRDGTLYEAVSPPKDASGAIISRVKIISKMDISERRKPQDGRLRVVRPGQEPVDFRVSSIPTMFGESIVMRLLDKSNLNADLDNLGFEARQFKFFKQAIHLPQGMVLVTGPTGSGKTTTLYSAVQELNIPDRKILTAENPIEFNLEGIVQTQIHHEIGYDFSQALRAFLRQDPEVIMVGEIRDLETAEIAYKAASTGHLVLSTLHTNDAASTITRLLDMGLPAFIVAESTSLIVAQRLLKKNCEKCKQVVKVEDHILKDLGVPEEKLSEFQEIQKGEGCDQCGGTGLRGRIPIFETLRVTSGVKESIYAGKSPLHIKKTAIAEDDFITLRRSALIRLQQGVVSIEQVIAGTVSDNDEEN
ncbi:MAG: Flp pilus assembly complex ATPase component TadA [Bdellovibrionaceae bacterium]|nr:Flp pilus assembly complex ATPase component TadA [Pseudobdellovibrionaceae bacterium]